MTAHPIEERSYAILRSRVDLGALPPLRRAVTERVIHASADVAYATDLVADEDHLRRGLRALREGAPVVADVAMVAAGITARRTVCSIGRPEAARLAGEAGITRSAAAVRLSFDEVGRGAVWVVGCAPTALAEIIERDLAPALVIGLPVGFVGAAEAKEALRASGLPAVSNVSEKGGSAVAAAALNALLYHRGEDPADENPLRGRSSTAGKTRLAVEAAERMPGGQDRNRSAS
jgi:precorrin-8X/cobalt-precorrin-8 methylmutase